MKKSQTVFVLLLVLLSGVSVFAQSTDWDQLVASVDYSTCTVPEGAPKPLLFSGARPSSLTLEATPLLSQPPLTSDTFPLEIVQVPRNAVVSVIDLDDQTQSWFRIVWPCGDVYFTGWVPSSTVNYSSRRANPKNAPPGCARAIANVTSINDIWESRVDGKIAVVVDLYRNTTGTSYPLSFFYITRNGRELRDRERDFESRGPLLFNGVAVGADVSSGNFVGFSVLNTARTDDELIFFGTIYSVPQGCEFGE